MAGGIFGVGYDTTGGIPPPLTAVVTDITLTGDGTLANPLSVVQNYWRIDGNNTAGVTRILGTTSNDDVHITTNNLTIGTWFQTGEWGVGLTDAATPLGRLHVRGTAATSATTAFFVENSTAARSISIDNASQIKRDTVLWSIHPDNTIKNEGVGYNTLASITSGTGNTAFGNEALTANTSGIHHTAVGTGALKANTIGNNSTAMGYLACTVTTGDDNTGVGFQALTANTTGFRNTAFGSQAMNNSNGAGNTAMGFNALFNVTGNNNVGVGSPALVSLVGGERNVALGYLALNGLISGSFNVAIGANSAGVYLGSYGVFIGHAAAPLVTGQQNVLMGGLSAQFLTTGERNVGIGYDVMHTTTTGSNNTIIGNQADTAAVGTNNAIAIGSGAVAATNELAFPSTVTATKIRGVSYTWPAADAAGVLTSNGSGTLSWAAVPAPALTATQIAFGDAGGLMTSSGGLTWDNAAQQLLLGDGTVTNPAYSFQNAADSGMYVDTAIKITAGAAAVLELIASARVTLTVGGIRVNGNDGVTETLAAAIAAGTRNIVNGIIVP